MKGAGASFQLVQTCRQTGLPRRWVQTPKQRPRLCNLHTGAALTLYCPAGNNAHVQNKQALFRTDVLPVGLQADRAEKRLLRSTCAMHDVTSLFEQVRWIRLHVARSPNAPSRCRRKTLSVPVFSVFVAARQGFGLLPEHVVH